MNGANPLIPMFEAFTFHANFRTTLKKNKDLTMLAKAMLEKSEVFSEDS